MRVTTQEFQTQIESGLRHQYSALDAKMAPSGLMAISTVLEVFRRDVAGIGRPCVLAYSDELHLDSKRILEYLSEKDDLIRAVTVPATLEGLVGHVAGEACQQYLGLGVLLFCESCSNPSGQVPDYDEVRLLRQQVEHCGGQLLAVVDNTWLSAGFNPFDHSIDVIVESLTKYTAAGRAIGGVILTSPACTSPNFALAVANYLVAHGSHVSPAICAVIWNELLSLESRLESASSNVQVIVKWLQQHRVRILHPMVNSTFAQQSFKFWPGVLYCRASQPPEQVLAALQRCQHVHFKTLYGSNEYKIDTDPLSDGSGGCMIRLAVSYDDDARLLQNVLSELDCLFFSH